MRVAAAMITLLYCGVVASAAAVNNDGAPGEVAVIKDDPTAVLTRLEALERRALERDSVTLEGQVDIKDRMLLKAIKGVFARWETPKCSDNGGGLLQLLLSQIGERVTQMAAEIRVLEARGTADAQTLFSEISERVTQMGATIQNLEAQITGDNQTLLSEISERVTQNGAEFRDFKAQSTADAQRLFSEISERVTQNGAEFRDFKAQSTAGAQRLFSEISERVTQNGAEFRDFKAQSTADAQRLQNMTKLLGQLEQTTQDAAASTFVRWGSSTCGNAASLVYEGVVGGGWYKHTGSAVNYLCLTLSPRLSDRASPPYFAELHGAEYETRDSHQDKDPVCAVCSAAFSTTLMIPATDTCTPGWSLQYSGFLMAGRHDHVAANEYVCVDRALESAHGRDRSTSNDNGKLMYFTKTKCGSLPCGPYVDDKIVTCVVCSK